MSKLFAIAVLALATQIGGAAELSLRETVRTHGPLVLLGDLAEIHAKHSVETAELASIDLFPSPALGEKRTLRLREVQDVLAVRGINLADHRFSGSSHVVIYGPQRTEVKRAAVEAPQRTVTAPKISKEPLVALVQRAIESRVTLESGEEDWQVSLSLNEDQVQKIHRLGGNLSVRGGKSPWTGKQRFLISAEASEDPPVQVTVNIAAPPAIVVARHVLPKGVILRADDVRLQRGLPTKGEAEVYHSIDEVVGKETTRVITENQVLDSRTVRPQLLVRRNEIVTLYSRAEGVSVRTTARARDDGAVGDLVTIESLQDRKPLFARVSGPQEVEIFAQAVSVATPTKQAARHPEIPLLSPPLPKSLSAMQIEGSR